MRARSSARAAPTSTRTSASAAWVGVEQETAATSSIRVRSDSCPIALITGSRSSATVRQRFSSQNAHRSVRLPPPRQTTATSTSSTAARSASARAISGAARRFWTGALAQTRVPRQPRRSSPASRSAQAARAAGADDADRPRQQRPREFLLGLQQAVGVEPPPRAVELGEQVALAGEPEVGGAQVEARRGGRGARVVVGPGGDHDLGAVAKRALGELEPVELVVPDRAPAPRPRRRGARSRSRPGPASGSPPRRSAAPAAAGGGSRESPPPSARPRTAPAGRDRRPRRRGRPRPGAGWRSRRPSRSGSHDRDPT